MTLILFVLFIFLMFYDLHLTITETVLILLCNLFLIFISLFLTCEARHNLTNF